MNETEMKREKLLQKRMIIQTIIKDVTKELIRCNSDDFSKETAIELREALIACDNILNGFTLRRM